MFTRVRVAAASGALFGHCSAAHFREDARGMQCEIWSESGRDQKPRLGQVSLVGLRSKCRRCRPLQSARAPFGLLRRTRHATVGSCRRPTRAPWRLPASSQAHYSEKIVYLLNSYQPKDNKRQSRRERLSVNAMSSRPVHGVDAPTTARTIRRAARRRHLARVFDRRREGYHGCLRKRGPNRRWPTPSSERHAKPSSIGDSAGIGSTTAQTKPRRVSDRDQNATRSAQDTSSNWRRSVFRITSSTPSSLACSLGASERRQFLLIRKYSQDRDANPLAHGARNRGAGGPN